jgi:hypothetical protein
MCRWIPFRRFGPDVVLLKTASSFVDFLEIGLEDDYQTWSWFEDQRRLASNGSGCSLLDVIAALLLNEGLKGSSGSTSRSSLASESQQPKKPDDHPRQKELAQPDQSLDVCHSF